MTRCDESASWHRMHHVKAARSISFALAEDPTRSAIKSALAKLHQCESFKGMLR